MTATNLSDIQNSLTNMPPSARVWVFGLSEELSADHTQRLSSGLASFVGTWNSHKVPVPGSAAIVYNRFILIAADNDQVHVSGCSTDSVFREVRRLTDEVGVKLADVAQVFYREDNSGVIRFVTRSDFQNLITEGTVSANTKVFDLTVSSLADLQSGKWELPFADSWHAKVFELPK